MTDGITMVHIYIGSNNLWIRFSAQPTQPKLELGTSQTTFVPRLYGQELALCQRYYEQMQEWTNGIYGIAFGTGSTTSKALLNFLVSKRASPTLTFQSASSFILQGASNNTLSAISAIGTNTNTAYISISAPNTTNGFGYALIDGSGASFIQVSSEL